MVGKFLCLIGRHHWFAYGETRIDYQSKWVIYEVSDAECTRCGMQAEVRRDYYW